MITWRKLWRGYFLVHRLALKFGIQIVPASYYSPVPDLRELQGMVDVWARKSSLPGIHVDLDQQVRILRTCCTPYAAEYAGNRVYRDAVARGWGLGFGYIEAQALHAFVRYHKPRNVVEVGSGVSTQCIAVAARENEAETGVTANITCIEPYPSTQLQSMGGVRLLTSKVQSAPLSVFEDLAEGDFLFIDSSHAVKPGGDVNFLFLEVLPRLKPGVLVHIHDIFLPYDFQIDALWTLWHWNETALLRAFLVDNRRAEILFCLSHLHYDRQHDLRELFPEYDPLPLKNGLLIDPFDYGGKHFPSSTYLQIAA